MKAFFFLLIVTCTSSVLASNGFIDLGKNAYYTPKVTAEKIYIADKKEVYFQMDFQEKQILLSLGESEIKISVSSSSQYREHILELEFQKLVDAIENVSTNKIVFRSKNQISTKSIRIEIELYFTLHQIILFTPLKSTKKFFKIGSPILRKRLNKFKILC